MVKKQQQLQIEIMYSRSQDWDTTYTIHQDNQSDGLHYSQILQFRNQYMSQHNIFTDVKMSYLNEDQDILPINQEFFLSYQDLSKIFDGNFVILLSPEIDEIETKIRDIEEKMIALGTQVQEIKKIKDAQNESAKDMFLKKHNSLPETIKKQPSDMPVDKMIDIGVLFSEPLVQKRDDTQDIKVLGQPVKYREEIERMKRSLNKTGKQKIYLKCCIANVESLAKLMRQKAKILHLVCHGSIQTEKKTGIQEGVLQFQQSHNIGCMDKIYGRQIPEFLANVPIDSIPKLVFVNACHSELIGDAFLKSGIPFVIVIQSSEKIQDTAAQLFAQKFYNSLFNGVGVKDSFEDAKDSLNRQNRTLNSNICCCIHTTSHQPKCLFKQLCEESEKQVVHQLYHVPSCMCLKRHLGIHQTDCVWAIDTLFAINREFRIGTNQDFRKPTPEELSEYGELMICCCSNKNQKIPHDETEKFKFKCNHNVNPNQVLYENLIFTDIETDINDETPMELRGNFARGEKLFGRSLNIFNLIQDIKQEQKVVLVYGAEGSGKSKVVTRALSYMYQRGYFQHQYIYLDMGNVTNSIDFNFEVIKTFKHLRMKLNTLLEIYMTLSSNKMAIIIDNLDNFIQTSYPQFKTQIQKMLAKLKRSKIILIMNQKVVKTLGPSILNEKRHYLEPLKKFAAADMFILHAKDYLKDINMRQVWKLFEAQNNRIPKTILDMVHFIKCNFSIVTKVSLCVVIEEMNKRDSQQVSTKENEKFLEQNIDQLQKDAEAFKLFLFLCEFKDGLTELDFNIMSNHQGEQIPEESALIPQNWRQIIGRLMYYDKEQKSSNIQVGSYYFCDVERVNDLNKVKVKKYILQFMKKQTKYVDQNMKFNALAYMSIFSMTILKIMREQYQHHEKIIEYCNFSNAGIFQYQREVRFIDYFDKGQYFPDAVENMSKSTRKNNDIDKGIKKLFQKRNSLWKVNPTSVFLHQTNIKQLYKTDYISYYKLLSQQKQKLFRYYFLTLMINVPSNIMIANDESNKQFLKYCIDKSISIVKQLLDENSKSIQMCRIKLYMMKLTIDLEAMEFPDIAMFKPHFESIQHCMKVWDSGQKIHKVIELDCHLLRLGILHKLLKVSSRPQTYSEIIERAGYFKEVYQTAPQDQAGVQILGAKVQLLLSQCFFFTREKAKLNHIGFAIFKVNFQYTKKLQRLKQAVQIFRKNNLKLLQVRTMVKAARFQFSIAKQRGKDAPLEDFFQIKAYIAEIRDISNNSMYNIVLKQSETELNDLEPKVTNIIQQKTKNFIVFMKSSPLTSSNQFGVINTVKRTHNFKAMIESIFQESILDIQPLKNKLVSVRFEILTRSACVSILKQGCSIVVLTIDAVLKGDEVYLYFQKQNLPIQDPVQLNTFLKQISFQNVKLVIICGQNSHRVGQRIQQINNGTCVIVTASYNGQVPSDHQNYYDIGYFIYSIKTLEKIAFSTLIRYLMQKIVYSKTPVKNYNIQEVVQASKQLTIFYMMRFSKQTSDQQKLRSIFDVKTHHCLKNKGVIQLEFKAGAYHNISTQRSTLNNLKELNEVYVGREKMLVDAMEEIVSAYNQKRPCYLNLYGNKSTGKSSFLKQLANCLIERGFYKKGIYYLSGSVISKDFQGNLSEYLDKNKTTIFEITFFNEQAIKNTSEMLVIIDDFHQIKQKSQYLDYFFNAIINKNVNLILSTDEKLSVSKQIPLFANKNILFMELKKLSQQQSSLLSYTFIPLYNFIEYNKLYKETFFNMKKQKTIIPQTIIQEFKELLFTANKQDEVDMYSNYKAYMQQLKKFNNVEDGQYGSMSLLQVPEKKLGQPKRSNTYKEMMKLSRKISGNR